jgi:predicted alpha/beta-hydrolase family hydrolase
MSKKRTELKIDGPEDARWTIALAHGAGVNMDDEFMAYFAGALAALNHRVVRFEFPYMAQRRATGKKKPPDRGPVLQATWQEVIQQVGKQGLVIAGKSMGGRIASTIADEQNVKGLVCLGYPFHPIGKPDQLRVDHLFDLVTPTLIIQGERDPFGNLDQVSKYKLPSRIQIRWMDDGDHSFKPRKASGRTLLDNWSAAVDQIGAFLEPLQAA